MWDVSYTLPTLVILVIITIAYLSRKRLPVRVSSAFGNLLVITLATVIIDYVSTRMDDNAGMFPAVLLWLANYLFFVLFLFRSFYMFWLPMELFDSKKLRVPGKIFKWIEVIEQVFLLAGSITGCIFSIQNGMYHSGPLYCYINLQFIVWIIIGFVIMVKMGKSIDIPKTGVYLYLTIMLVGILVRSFMPHVVIMNIFCMFAIMVIYLMYLNPDQYIDDITRCFNLKGWQKVLNEVTMFNNFYMTGFGIRNYAALRETRGRREINYSLSEIGGWIRHTWPRLSVFYIGNGIFIISHKKWFDQEAVINAVNERFQLSWDSNHGDYYLSVNQMKMEKKEIIESGDILSDAMQDVYQDLIQPDEREIITVDKGLIQKYVRKSEAAKRLTEALEQDELAMFLQPIVNAKTDQVDGAEALCRLPDGKGGYVYPDVFIPLAMQAGNIGRLGRQMFRKACAFMSREEVRFSNIKWINVNVAPEQFRNPKLLDQFLDILEEYKLDPSMIHLEITEETMIDRTLLHDNMEKFSEHGFIFSMDDFGSSYSNMIRLQQNHFSDVKIDRDFTWSYFKQKTTLLPDIIRTCHNLGMQVVTEGVETKEMVDGVKEIHVDYIQGYYYSKPIPADEFLEKYVSR